MGIHRVTAVSGIVVSMALCACTAGTAMDSGSDGRVDSALDGDSSPDAIVDTDAAPDADAANDGTDGEAGVDDLRAQPAHTGPDAAQAIVIPAYVTRRFHVAADGDDSRTENEATNPATPWRTIDRANAAVSSLQPGDAVLFRRGDVFRGTLHVTREGSADARIFFGSYGSAAAMPVIAGTDVVTGFVADKGMRRRAAIANAVMRVFVDGVEMPLARTPNSGLLRNADPSNMHVAASGLGAIDWTGGRVWVHTEAWLRESRGVASQSGDTLNFDSPTAYEARANAGFVAEGVLAALDAPGEWFYGDGTLRLQLPDGAAWETAAVEATTREHAVVIGEGANASHLEFRGLEFARSAGAAFWQAGFTCEDIVVTDCVFRSADTEGIAVSGNNPNSRYERNLFAGVNGAAAVLSGSDHSVFARNAVLDQFMNPQRGMGSGTGCGPGGCTAATFEENYFARSGFHALSVTSDRGGIVRRNVVVDALQLMSDGGAIYAYGGDTTELHVVDNVVVGARGNGAGAADGYDGAYGIYMDNAVPGAEIARNTLIDCHFGIFFNAGGSGSWAEDNTVVGGRWGMQFNTAVRDARRNLVVATEADAPLVVVDAISGASSDVLGILDENVYRQPVSGSFARAPGGTRDWMAWRTDFMQDGASRYDGTQWPSGATAEDLLRVLANTSLAARTYDVGSGWRDVRTGEASPSSITLEPFATRVLERP